MRRALIVVLVVMVAASGLGFALTRPAQAGPTVEELPRSVTVGDYTYTTVIISGEQDITSLNPPSVNDNAEVSFLGNTMTFWSAGQFTFSDTAIPAGNIHSDHLLTPDGAVVYSAYQPPAGNTTFLWEPAVSEQALFEYPKGSRFDVTSPDGRWLVSGGRLVHEDTIKIDRYWIADGVNLTAQLDLVHQESDPGQSFIERRIIDITDNGDYLIFEYHVVSFVPQEVFYRIYYASNPGQVLLEYAGSDGYELLYAPYNYALNANGDLLYFLRRCVDSVCTSSLNTRSAAGEVTAVIPALPFTLNAILGYTQEGQPLFSTYAADPQYRFLTGYDLEQDRFSIPFMELFGQGGDIYHLSGSAEQKALAALVQLTDSRYAIVLAERLQPKPRYPVIVVPGIVGTYARSLDDLPWLMQRGFPQAGIQVDPIGRFYDDWIKTLKNLGYVEGKDLFVVAYDWRLPPGPLDGALDGHVGGLSAAGIADSQYSYAVDYLGEKLAEAADAWRTEHDEELPYVHIVAHSTGGLLARTYIQSDAYGGVYDNVHTLPEVDQFFMIGVPNRGASKPWNVLNNNFIGDEAYRMLLSKILLRAYVRVVGQDQVIPGPDYDISKADLLVNGQPSPQEFIIQYVPTLRALLATYDFYGDLEGGAYHDINSDPAQRNNWVLDLNNGLDLVEGSVDANAWTAQVGAVHVIYGDGVDTKFAAREMLGPAEDVIAKLNNFVPIDATEGKLYYLDLPGHKNGDGTVPIISAAGQFFGDSRVNLYAFAQGRNTAALADHTALVGNPDVQKLMLDTLAIDYEESDLSTGLAAPDLLRVVMILDGIEIEDIFFPDLLNAGAAGQADVVLVDGLGRRLGYTTAEGPISEIPGSVWIGSADGSGYLYGTPVAPLTVQISGSGTYNVHLTLFDGLYSGGLQVQGAHSGPPQSLSVPLTLTNPLRLYIPLAQNMVNTGAP